MKGSQSVFFRAVRKFRKSPISFLCSLPRLLRKSLVNWLMEPASKNDFAASLYFLLLSNEFHREHRTVLAGMVEFKKTRLSTKRSFGGFRRNIHRIEKGLTMQPRRKVFAEGYIAKVVSQYAASQRDGSNIHEGERKWAKDVLTSYFSVVEETEVVARARSKFLELESSTVKDSSSDRLFVPYVKEELKPSGIDFDSLQSLFLERRSVRWFDNLPVQKEKVKLAVKAASWAPTACNRMPYCFHAFYGEDAKKIAGYAGGTAGWAQNLPCLIVVVGDLSNYVEVRDRHLIYIDASLASMQLMLALQVLGLSSVPINWPDVEDREIMMSNELKLSSFERPIMLLGVGYGATDGLIPYSQKKPVEILLKERD